MTKTTKTATSGGALAPPPTPPARGHGPGRSRRTGGVPGGRRPPPRRPTDRNRHRRAARIKNDRIRNNRIRNECSVRKRLSESRQDDNAIAYLWSRESVLRCRWGGLRGGCGSPPCRRPSDRPLNVQARNASRSRFHFKIFLRTISRLFFKIFAT